MTQTVTVSAGASDVSGARVTAKVLHWMVLGWTAFCAASFLIGVARTGAAGQGALASGFGAGLWPLLWVIPVCAGETIAIGLSMTSGPSPSYQVLRREWVVSFLIALVPNGVLALMLLFQAVS